MPKFEAVQSSLDPTKISLNPDQDVTKLRLYEHPKMPKGEGPKDYDVMDSEVDPETLKKFGLNVVRFELLRPGQTESEVHTINEANWKKLHAEGVDPVEVLANAAKAKTRRLGGSASAAAVETNGNGEINYRDPLNSGRSHRGLTTEQEKMHVRQRFPLTNLQNLLIGDRPLDHNNPEHAKRYDLFTDKGEPRFFTGTVTELFEQKPAVKEDFDKAVADGHFGEGAAEKVAAMMQAEAAKSKK